MADTNHDAKNHLNAAPRAKRAKRNPMPAHPGERCGVIARTEGLAA
ncbi:hypothetical protein PH7735_03243 [Shimia thalassica]|uniref:Uncharacterized protein n=1 Tax=Shimia thalassica TaxID=1715693 RepID=A0A0P1IUM1_9RHOB|nr:hypothetical protein PH7735_03243 [Shimia thalassica]